MSNITRKARISSLRRAASGQCVTLGGAIEGPLVVPLQKFGLLPERARNGRLGWLLSTAISGLEGEAAGWGTHAKPHLKLKLRTRACPKRSQRCFLVLPRAAHLAQGLITSEDTVARRALASGKSALSFIALTVVSEEPQLCRQH